MQISLQARAQNALAQALATALPAGALDGNARTELLSQSLIEGITGEQLAAVVAQISQGDGGELRERDGKRPKLHSAYSSAALAVNAFAVWLGREAELDLAEASGFERICFEEKCAIGLRGKTPNLDLIAFGSEDVVAVESKCTEHLAGHAAQFSEAYGARVVELAEGGWQAEFEELEGNPARYTFLNAAQLVKHYLGLRNTYPDRRCTLLYLYWEPANPDAYEEFLLHRTEVDRFRAAVQGSAVRFEAQSHRELWSRWDNPDAPTWLLAHVERLRRRYGIAV